MYENDGLADITLLMHWVAWSERVNCSITVDLQCPISLNLFYSIGLRMANLICSHTKLFFYPMDKIKSLLKKLLLFRRKSLPWNMFIYTFLRSIINDERCNILTLCLINFGPILAVHIHTRARAHIHRSAKNNSGIVVSPVQTKRNKCINLTVTYVQ